MTNWKDVAAVGVTLLQGSCCRGRDSKGTDLEPDGHKKVLVKTFCNIQHTGGHLRADRIKFN
jgi:hypothetical protein